MQTVLCAPLAELLVVLLAARIVGVLGSPPRVVGAREVRAAVGGRAELSCSVDHMPPGVQLSWVRRPGLQVLWSGNLRFSGGVRVSARREGEGGTHTLTVDLLRHSDAGLYECQLNTDPKASWTTRLIVLDEPDPELEVWAETEGVRVRESETAAGAEVTLPEGGGELRCRGRGTLRWEREGQEIQETHVLPCPDDPSCSVSVLLLSGAGAAGGYSCRGGGGKGDITVRVQDPPAFESRWEDMLGDAAGAGVRVPGGRAQTLTIPLLILQVTIFF